MPRWLPCGTGDTSTHAARLIQSRCLTLSVTPTDDPDHAGVLGRLRKLADERWDLARFDDEVRRSQARRWVVYEALRNGAFYPWDYQPLQKASDRFMRNHLDLNDVEEKQRFPRGE